MSQWASGIDIGHMAIRAVVMRQVKGQWKIHEYGQVDRFYGASDKSLRQELAELTTKVALKGPVYVSDSGMSIMVRYITTVPLPADRLQRLVRLDLEQHADDSGDLAADMKVLPLAGDELVVCCPLAQPRQVNELLFELKRSRVSAEAVSLPAACTFNALRHILITNDSDGYSDDYSDGRLESKTSGDPKYNLIIDIGAKQTRLILSRDDEFLACRSLPFGGLNFTAALSEDEGRTLRDAEKLKVSGLASKSSLDAFKRRDDRKSESAATVATVATTAPIFDDDTSTSDDLEDDLFFDDEKNNEKDKNTVAHTNVDDDDLFDDEDEEDIVVVAQEDGSGSQDGDEEKDERKKEQSDELSFTAFETPAVSLEDGNSLETVGADVSDTSDDLFDGLELPAPGSQTQMIGVQQLGDDLVRVAEQLHVQIAGSLKWFQVQLNLSKMDIQQVHFCGGGSALVGLARYLEHRMQKKVTTASCDARLHDHATEEMQPYVTAIGAALHVESDPNTVHFDLRPESVLRKEAWKRDIVWPRIAAAILLIAGILWAVALSRQQNASIESSTALEEHKKQRAAYLAELTSLQEDRDTLYEDLRGISSRIYAGRDLLNAIRALKEEAPRDLWIITFRTENINNEKDAKQRGNRRSGRGNQSPIEKAAHRDTAVNRGSIYVSGRVMPQKKLPVSQLHGQLQRWIDSIDDWKESPDSQTLFQSSRVMKTNNQNVEDDRLFTFEVKFDFQETTMKTVTDTEDLIHKGDKGNKGNKGTDDAP